MATKPPTSNAIIMVDESGWLIHGWCEKFSANHVDRNWIRPVWYCFVDHPSSFTCCWRDKHSPLSINQPMGKAHLCPIIGNRRSTPFYETIGGGFLNPLNDEDPFFSFIFVGRFDSIDQPRSTILGIHQWTSLWSNSSNHTKPLWVSWFGNNDDSQLFTTFQRVK